jgi:hypothetical protein
MRKACVVRNIDTNDLYKFTLGKQGQIIITDERHYDVKRLVVSLKPLEEVQFLDNDYYVVIQGEYDD